VANRQILSEVLLALFIILFIIFLPVVRGLQRRYRIRIWVKSFTASREARKHKQLSEARRLLEAALKTAGRLPRHWKMRAFTYDEFAALSIAEGKYPEAEQFKRSGLLLREKFDGPRAPETVIATSSLAALLDEVGKSAEAEPLHRHAAQTLQGLPGFEVEASNALNNYASCLHKLGRVDESASLYQQSMALAKQAGIDEPAQSANSLNNLAVAMSDTARYAEAEALHREVLAARQKGSGPDSLSAAASLTNLGAVKMRQGEYIEAEELLAKAKEIRDKELPADHPQRLSALNNQAIIFSKQGRYGESAALHAEVLAGRERILGPDHPEVSASLMNLAMAQSTLGQNRDAEANLDRSLAIARRAFGEQHPGVADKLNKPEFSPRSAKCTAFNN